MFNFIALLKRQFLLCFWKRFIFLSIVLSVTLCINIIFLNHYGTYTANILSNALSSLIYLVCFSFFNTTSFGQDLNSKNKNIKVTPTNDYLIHFSYFVYAFLVNAAAKLLFSLLSFVLIFLFFGVFYYQAIYLVFLEAFMFGFYFANMEIFLMFFLRKFIKYVSIIFIIFNVLSLFVAKIIAQFIPTMNVDFTVTFINPGYLIILLPTNVFYNITGCEVQLFGNKSSTLAMIFLVVMFLMLFMQIIFVFVFGERKSILKK